MALKFRKLLKSLLPIFIGVFCIYYSFKYINFLDFKQYFYQIDYSWVFIGIILGALSHISRSYRWKYLIEPMGYQLGFLNSTLAVFSAYLINYTVPRAGDVARATMISKYEKIPFEKTLGTIVAERAIDVLCILIIISIGLVIEFERILEKIISFSETKDLTFILLMLIVVVLIILLTYNLLKRSSLKNKLTIFFSGLYEGLVVIFKMEKKIQFIFHSIFIWLMYILMFWVTSKAFIELHDTSFFQMMISFTLAALSIMLSNGGIGIYPLAVEESLGWYGIQSATGLAFGWVMWLSQTLMVIIFGGLSLFILPFVNRNKI